MYMMLKEVHREVVEDQTKHNCTIHLGTLLTSLLRGWCRSSLANNLYDVTNAGGAEDCHEATE